MSDHLPTVRLTIFAFRLQSHHLMHILSTKKNNKGDEQLVIDRQSRLPEPDLKLIKITSSAKISKTFVTNINIQTLKYPTDELERFSNIQIVIRYLGILYSFSLNVCHYSLTSHMHFDTEST